MMVDGKKLTQLLKNPPKKQVYCSWCGGTGIINCRGYRQSDVCDKCYGDKKGVSIIDYAKWQRQIKKCVLAKQLNARKGN